MKPTILYIRALCCLLFLTATGFLWSPCPAAAQTGRETVYFYVTFDGPSLYLATPTSGLRVSNSVFTIQGSTSLYNSQAVTNVYFSLNSLTNVVPAVTTNGWNTWSAAVNLIAGVNTLSAYAVDSSGTHSMTTNVQFVAVLSTQLSVQTNGRGALSPNYNNVSLIVGQNYSITATPAAGFAFTNWTGSGSLALTNGRTLKFTMESNLVLTANFVDIIRPTLSLTTTSQQVSNSEFRVTGRAGDNWGVSNVVCMVNGMAWTAATTNRWTNWWADVTLASGANTVQAYAVDAGGNLSPTSKISVVYIVSAPLVVLTNQTGWGSITPGYNGALLQVGKTYTMTARANPGFVFTNWVQLNVFTTSLTTYNYLGQPNPPITNVVLSPAGLTNTPTLLFTMTSPEVLVAEMDKSVVEGTGFQAYFVDVQKPVVTILHPTADQMVASNSFVISGKASDNAAVASVWYQFNGGGWLNPVGLTNWSVAVALNSGTNTVMTYAVDTSGNVSSTNTVHFVSVDKLPLVVDISGKGSVSPNYNKDLLQVGQNYTMTARPAAGFAFSNWSLVNYGLTIIMPIVRPKDVVITTPTGPVYYPSFPSSLVFLTNSPTLTFSMSQGMVWLTNSSYTSGLLTSGLELQASFVDIAPPTVTITAPTASAHVSNTVFTITGKAADNVAVAEVFFQINGGGWQYALSSNGWTNWYTYSVNLLSQMTNVVQAYAVDTAGNVSATQTVKFVNLQMDPAPYSLAGTILIGSSSPYANLYNYDFGTNTFSGYFGEPAGQNPANTVGDFSYAKTSANEGQLILTNTAPPSAAGGVMVLDLTFNSQTSAEFYNETIGDEGSITFYPLAAPLLPSLPGKTLTLIDQNQVVSTLALGTGVLTLTNGLGVPQTEPYSFQPYSFLSGLLTAGDGSDGTNYVILTIQTTNSGNYYSSAYDAAGNPQGTDTGQFVFPSAQPAPVSLAGKEADVSSVVDFAETVSFSSSTYSLYDFFSTNDSEGTYTYVRQGGGVTRLTLTPTSPPSAVNGSIPLVLTFLDPSFCLVSDPDDTTNFATATFYSPPVLVPASPAGRTIYATNYDSYYVGSTIDVITFSGNGTFSQFETNSATPGLSGGTYTYATYGPVGASVTLKYTRPAALAGSTNYVLADFFGTTAGAFNSLFYDNAGDPSQAGSGDFSIH